MAQCHVGARRVGHRHDDRERTRARLLVRIEAAKTRIEGLRPAHAGAPIHADTIAIGGSQIERARIQRLARGGDGKLRDAVDVDGFGGREHRLGLPIDDPGDLHARIPRKLLGEAADAGGHECSHHYPHYGRSGAKVMRRH